MIDKHVTEYVEIFGFNIPVHDRITAWEMDQLERIHSEATKQAERAAKDPDYAPTLTATMGDVRTALTFILSRCKPKKPPTLEQLLQQDVDHDALIEGVVKLVAPFESAVRARRESQWRQRAAGLTLSGLEAELGMQEDRLEILREMIQAAKSQEDTPPA